MAAVVAGKVRRQRRAEENAFKVLLKWTIVQIAQIPQIRSVISMREPHRMPRTSSKMYHIYDLCKNREFSQINVFWMSWNKVPQCFDLQCIGFSAWGGLEGAEEGGVEEGGGEHQEETRPWEHQVFYMYVCFPWLYLYTGIIRENTR